MGDRTFLRPGFLVNHVFNPIARMFGTPVLVVRGRVTGEEYTTPVNVLDLEGTRYLVAVRGETQWVRNARAAGSVTLRTRGRDESYSVRELDDAEKAPVIAAYLQRWGRQVGKFFRQLPDPSDHPTFALIPGA